MSGYAYSSITLSPSEHSLNRRWHSRVQKWTTTVPRTAPAAQSSINLVDDGRSVVTVLPRESISRAGTPKLGSAQLPAEAAAQPREGGGARGKGMTIEELKARRSMISQPPLWPEDAPPSPPTQKAPVQGQGKVKSVAELRRMREESEAGGMRSGTATPLPTSLAFPSPHPHPPTKPHPPPPPQQPPPQPRKPALKPSLSLSQILDRPSLPPTSRKRYPSPPPAPPPGHAGVLPASHGGSDTGGKGKERREDPRRVPLPPTVSSVASTARVERELLGPSFAPSPTTPPSPVSPVGSKSVSPGGSKPASPKSGNPTPVPPPPPHPHLHPAQREQDPALRRPDLQRVMSQTQAKPPRPGLERKTSAPGERRLESVPLRVPDGGVGGKHTYPDSGNVDGRGSGEGRRGSVESGSTVTPVRQVREVVRREESGRAGTPHPGGGRGGGGGEGKGKSNGVGNGKGNGNGNGNPKDKHGKEKERDLPPLPPPKPSYTADRPTRGKDSSKPHEISLPESRASTAILSPRPSKEQLVPPRDSREERRYEKGDSESTVKPSKSKNILRRASGRMDARQQGGEKKPEIILESLPPRLLDSMFGRSLRSATVQRREETYHIRERDDPSWFPLPEPRRRGSSERTFEEDRYHPEKGRREEPIRPMLVDRGSPPPQQMRRRGRVDDEWEDVSPTLDHRYPQREAPPVRTNFWTGRPREPVLGGAGEPRRKPSFLARTFGSAGMQRRAEEMERERMRRAQWEAAERGRYDPRMYPGPPGPPPSQSDPYDRASPVRPAPTPNQHGPPIHPDRGFDMEGYLSPRPLHPGHFSPSGASSPRLPSEVELGPTFAFQPRRQETRPFSPEYRPAPGRYADYSPTHDLRMPQGYGPPQPPPMPQPQYQPPPQPQYQPPPAPQRTQYARPFFRPPYPPAPTAFEPEEPEYMPPGPPAPYPPQAQGGPMGRPPMQAPYAIPGYEAVQPMEMPGQQRYPIPPQQMAPHYPAPEMGFDPYPQPQVSRNWMGMERRPSRRTGGERSGRMSRYDLDGRYGRSGTMGRYAGQRRERGYGSSRPAAVARRRSSFMPSSSRIPRQTLNTRSFYRTPGRTSTSRRLPTSSRPSRNIGRSSRTRGSRSRPTYPYPTMQIPLITPSGRRAMSTPFGAGAVSARRGTRGPSGRSGKRRDDGAGTGAGWLGGLFSGGTGNGGKRR